MAWQVIRREPPTILFGGIMDNVQTAGSGGIGIGGLTFVILLILKIIGETQLSWFVVITSLIWAPLVASLVIIVIVLGIIAIWAIIILIMKV